MVTQNSNRNHFKLEEILRNVCCWRFSRNPLCSEKFISVCFWRQFHLYRFCFGYFFTRLYRTYSIRKLEDALASVSSVKVSHNFCKHGFRHRKFQTLPTLFLHVTQTTAVVRKFPSSEIPLKYFADLFCYPPPPPHWFNPTPHHIIICEIISGVMV